MRNLKKSIALLVICFFCAISVMAEKKKEKEGCLPTYIFKGATSHGKQPVCNAYKRRRKKPEISQNIKNIRKDGRKISKNEGKAFMQIRKNAIRKGPKGSKLRRR